MRLFGMAIAVFCVSMVLTGLAALGYFAYTGTLTQTNVQEILAILKDETSPTAAEPEVDETPFITNDQLIAERTKQILSLTDRERELELIKRTIAEQSEIVLKERGMLEQLRSSFLKQLETLKAEITTEAADQSRGILLKMRPEVAVVNLMAMTKEEAIVVMKGMAEKDAAKLLETFLTVDPKRAEEIFLAISRGKPVSDLVEQTENAVRPQAPSADTN